jgi:hypothetical protein
MRRHVQNIDQPPKRRRRRKTLALPYASKPNLGPVRFNPSLHTAAELVRSAHDPAA